MDTDRTPSPALPRHGPPRRIEGLTSTYLPTTHTSDTTKPTKSQADRDQDQAQARDRDQDQAHGNTCPCPTPTTPCTTTTTTTAATTPTTPAKPVKPAKPAKPSVVAAIAKPVSSQPVSQPVFKPVSKPASQEPQRDGRTSCRRYASGRSSCAGPPGSAAIASLSRHRGRGHLYHRCAGLRPAWPGRRPGRSRPGRQEAVTVPVPPPRTIAARASISVRNDLCAPLVSVKTHVFGAAFLPPEHPQGIGHPPR